MNNDNNVSLAITPDSDIYLLKVPFEIDNTNQLTFANVTAQTNYFMSLDKLYLEDATYQRKEGILRYPANFDDIVTYNYCMYRNTAFSNKWYYAYIDDIRFENPNMSTIRLRTDVFQTWQFDIVYKKMFVEREHVNVDTIGLHTIPEGLETGDFICNNADNITIGSADLICCLCTDFPPLLEQYFKKSTYNSIFSGAKGVIFATTQDASYFIAYMEAQNKGNSIVSLFMLPNATISGDMTFYTKRLDMDPSIFGVNYVDVTFAPVDESTGETYMGTANVTRPTTLNGYTPKNNKMFTGAYNYFYITNNGGANVEFHYEDFVSNTPTFELIGAFAVGGSIKLLPKNYLKYSDVNDTRYFYNYGISASKYPICSWNSDSYTVWLSENSLNIAIENVTNIASMVGGAMSLGVGISTGNPLAIMTGGGALLSGGGGILDTMKEKYLHSRMSDVVKGSTNVGDVQFASGKSCFTIYKMSVRQEYAKIIDDYFSAFGYKVNEYKIPNITGRTNWNYVKTIGCNILGDIPQRDIQELKGIFNNGVTFWHNPLTFLDYSQTNSIVS